MEENMVYEGEVVSAEEANEMEPDVVIYDMPPAETSNGKTALAVAGVVAVVGAVGFGAYKGIKKLKTVLDAKSEEKAIQKLTKRGYYIEIPQRDPIEDRPEAEEQDFVPEETSEGTSKKKK